MKIEIGTTVIRHNKKWNITRIEIYSDGSLAIFACPENKYLQHKDNPDKTKMYHHDELWLKFDGNLTTKYTVNETLKNK